MDLLEPISPVLDPHLRRELNPGELLLALLASDLDLDGRYGENWLALTDERLLVVRANGGSPEVRSWPLEQVRRVQTRSHVGSGSLMLEMPDGTHELVRFSQGNYFKFSAVPQAVEAAMAEPVEADDEEQPQAIPPRRVEHCESCGRALRAGSKVCPHCIRKRETLWRLFSYVRPYRKTAALGLLLTASMTVVSLVPPLLNGYLIDEVITPVLIDRGQATAEGVPVPPAGMPAAEDPQGPPGISSTAEPRVAPPGSVALLAAVVLGLLGAHFGAMILNGARTWTLGWLGQRVTYDLQIQIFNYLQALSLSFYSRHSTGRIMTRVTQDTERMRGFITTGFQDLLVALLTLVGIGVILLLKDWTLALLVLLPTPVMLLVTQVYRKRIHWVFHSIWRRVADLNGQLADTIPGVKVVKAFAQEEREMRAFGRRNSELLAARMVSVKMQAWFQPGIAFITATGAVILWWFGGNRVLEGSMSIGDLQIFIGYMMRFYAPVQQLSRLSNELERAATSSERVFEILDTEPEVMDEPGARDPGVIEGRVEFRDVSFTYDGVGRILDRVSFDVEPGEMIGLVGHSGAGKSTLVNLISRMYEATDGEILVDGEPIVGLQQKRLRAQIGVVLQEPLLFQGSIAQNIAYGLPEASRSEIIAAARAANAHGFIMRFPDGYDTEVGERGGRLSGGERQRISIARALIGNPRILILDEATSSVDTQTEYEIQEALERLIANRTTFAIAHRLSTLKNADRLLVLDKGRIVEEGTHADLLVREEGVYRRLVDMQTELARVRAL
ncbi:MAG: ABC transporter ATP-binding protein [Gemmatimonadaceae bacterium]|nr:ABC transporter ATP-binding protein [Gemmatimonadaceae bacterium]